MAERIAQLFAEISADTSKLEKGLAGSKKGLTELRGDLDKTGQASERTAEATKTTGRALDEMGQSGRTTGMSIKELASSVKFAAGALGVMAVVGKQAFEFGKQGAEVAQTTESFARLIDKVGASSSLLRELRDASAGTVSDMKLMSATTTLLAGASGDLATSLANATPELLEIAKAANKLNPTLGDTTFLYESLALGVKRASPMILDNLGLTIKIGEANERYAQQIGKTVEQLTAEEQKQALLNETLRAGKVLIDQAGGAAGSATDEFARFEATTQNLTNSLKLELLPTLSSAFGALDLLLTWNDKLAGAYTEHRGEVLKTAASYEEYTTEILRAAVASGQITQAQANLILMWAKGDDELRQGGIKSAEEFAAQIGLLGEEEFKTTQQIDKFNVAAHAQGWAMRQQAEEAANAARSADAYSARLQGLADSMGIVGKANFSLAGPEIDPRAGARASAALSAGMGGGITSAWEAYQAVIADTTPEIEKLTAEIARMQAAQGQTFSVVTEATTSLDEYELATIRAAAAAQKLAEYTDDDREEFLKLSIAAANAQEKVVKLGEGFGYTEEFTLNYTSKIKDANGALDELNAKELAAAEALKTATAQFLFQQLAVVGNTESNLALARALGLIDEPTYAAAYAAQALTEGYRNTAEGAAALRVGALELADAIAKLQSKNITITVDTIYNTIRTERVIKATAAAGGIVDPKSVGTDLGIPGKAAGGPVSAGQMYLVGERGPEMFVPGGAGHIIPNGGSMGPTWSGDIVIQGVNDPRQAADLVVQKLQDRGMLSGAALR